MDTDSVSDTDVIANQETEIAPLQSITNEDLRAIVARSDRLVSHREVEHERHHEYPSLYDTPVTTVVAVVLGLILAAGIQAMIWQIYRNAKTDYRALTQFVTMMVGLVLAAYMADLLIAGPDTSLLSDDEHTVILGFVKDICLMVFSYYFGTRSNGGKAEAE